MRSRVLHVSGNRRRKYCTWKFALHHSIESGSCTPYGELGATVRHGTYIDEYCERSELATKCKLTLQGMSLLLLVDTAWSHMHAVRRAASRLDSSATLFHSSSCRHSFPFQVHYKPSCIVLLTRVLREESFSNL